MSLTTEQHAARDAGIGSSDAAAAVGMSPWKTPVQLWMEKTGRVEREDISEKDLIIFGHALEDVVAQEFARRNHKRVQRKSTPYRREFMVANVDRLIVGHDAILECKTADKYTRHKWEEVPEHYRIQVEHQLITAGKNEAVLAVLIGGNEYRDFEIVRHPGLSEHLIEGERRFWHHVTTDTPPEPINAADVVALYPVDSGNVKIATPELREIHAELMAIRDQYRDFGKRKDALEERIKLFLGPDSEVVFDQESGRPLATWKGTKPRDVVMWETVARQLAPNEDELNAAILAHTVQKSHRMFLPKQLPNTTTGNENE